MALVALAWVITSAMAWAWAMGHAIGEQGIDRQVMDLLEAQVDRISLVHVFSP